jgi:3-deoxy-D-manno-octulosonate 8-phosphate phosphatase (KDO 8-P phosphatase)
MVETKGFDSQDGIALQWLNWYNIATGMISGRVSPASEERARQVKMAYVYQGHIEKIPISRRFLRRAAYPPKDRLHRRRPDRYRGHAARGSGRRHV